MKLLNYIGILLALPMLLHGTTLEMASFEEILPYVHEETLVLCDIDNTLIESTRHLGSTQWGEYIIRKLKASGKTDEEAYALESELWYRVQPYLTMRLVDPATLDVLNHLKEKGIHTLCLTARYPSEAQYTHDQLLSVSVDFIDAPTFFKDKILFDLQHQPVYDRNILFCTCQHTKSEVLKAYLNHSKHMPQRILFIDDKWHHVHDLEKSLLGTGIEFIGVRFSGADERVRAFDPELAEIQLNALPIILSDEEAEQYRYEGNSKCQSVDFSTVLRKS